MSTRTIVVTGSNRGIGQGIIQLLANTQHDPPLTIYATSRAGKDLNISGSHSNQIRYAKLDVSDKSSITSFLESHGQDVNVLINNAGINNNNDETPDLAAQTIEINYRGTKQMCELFLSQSGMRDTKGARIVNVSSTACQLSNYAPTVQEKFRSVKSVGDVDGLAEEYLAAVKQGKQETEGWGSGAKSYQVSKALINALTVVLSRQHSDVLINCCCPGWVATDMGGLIGGKPPKSLEEGARIPVRLAIGQLGSAGDGNGGLDQETDKVTGKYFGNDGVTDRGWGKARGW